jgi:Ubiquitin carboxyl-terminal hydrolase
MADVAMGQTLNTVSCPHCHYESRSFDPFNLLSIPVPAVAEAVFQCKLIRRATPRNCPWVLNRPRKLDKVPVRYNIRPVDTATGAPSEAFIAETYVIALSRLADGGDLKLQLQNLSGISVRCLRLCRSEEFVVNEFANDKSCLKTFTKIIPLTDKDTAASQHAKRRDGDETQKGPIQIIAFETTMSPRQIQEIKDTDTNSETDEPYPSTREKAIIDLYLQAYSDEKEGRICDTDPIVIAKAVSRSLWPRNEGDLKVGLRVDALDHKGNFVPGRVCAINESFIEGQDTDTGEVHKIAHRKIVVHFDNFLARWDEEYTYEAFRKHKILPLYTKTESKNRVSEHMISHRWFDRTTRKSSYFGLSFLVQLKNEWSTARAGAHILLQASRFLYRRGHHHQDMQHLTDKVYSHVSDLIDVLLDRDKEYIRQCLGLSDAITLENGCLPYRNPAYKGEDFASASKKKISELMKNLPFDLVVCTDPETIKKPSVEKPYSFAIDDTVGNFINSNNTLILQWREPSTTIKTDFKRVDPILYSHPQIHAHAASADVLKTFLQSQSSRGGDDEPSQDGLDLTYCLTNYCKEQKLLLSDNWICPKCKKVREAPQKLTLWRMPDLLTFHIKRFNMSARWHEKILTKVNFPMTGLDKMCTTSLG